MTKRPTHQFKAPVSLDDWHLGNWPDELLKTMKIKTEVTNYGAVEITFEVSDSVDDVVRRFIEQGIKAFFDEVYFEFTERGFKLEAPDGTTALIPYRQIDVMGTKGMAALHRLIKRIERQWREDDAERAKYEAAQAKEPPP